MGPDNRVKNRPLREPAVIQNLDLAMRLALLLLMLLCRCRVCTAAAYAGAASAAASAAAAAAAADVAGSSQDRRGCPESPGIPKRSQSLRWSFDTQNA